MYTVDENVDDTDVIFISPDELFASHWEVAINVFTLCLSFSV